jgi:hypothetical protein
MGRTTRKAQGSWSDIAVVLGKAVIRAEHEFFVRDLLDNGEHVPRIRRVADAMGRGLRDLGLPMEQVAPVSDSLVAYGRELFLAEWMSQASKAEDSATVLAEGGEEFDRILAGSERWGLDG